MTLSPACNRLQQQYSPITIFCPKYWTTASRCLPYFPTVLNQCRSLQSSLFSLSCKDFSHYQRPNVLRLSPASTLRARRLAFLVVRAKAELNTPRFVPLPRAPFPASTTHYSSFRDIIAHLRLRIRAIFYDRRRYTSYCFPGLAGRDQFLAVLL